jgi:hypothetical protein
MEEAMHRRLAALLTIVLAGCTPAVASAQPGAFTVEVIVDGRPLAEYAARGTRYVEAAKGREYAIRLHNPSGVRVAVALSVDGLNTIDARRTSAQAARKWVLGPYETVTISGWQVDRGHARRFYFTSEERAYAGWLGRPDDMGVISAVFFRERWRGPVPIAQAPAGTGRDPSARRQGENAGAPASPAAADAAAVAQDAEEYAATGIGRETGHPVQTVAIDLEERPAASLSIRYEYRPQLVRLGILPPGPPDALARRERARGFDQEYCPVPR